MKHPAKYSNCLLPIFKTMLTGCDKVLDPFGGTGKLKLVRPDAVILEIEPEWAAISGAIVGDATNMPFRDREFDGICTSPTYGNRMADSFVCTKGYKRNTYRHTLGRELNPNNSGGMNWGYKYKELHRKAWAECYRVLKYNGIFILNISDHIRKGMVIPVTEWHIKELESLGFRKINHAKIETPRNRMGSNSLIRVDYESVICFVKSDRNEMKDGA